jgi:hypothetical protein
VIGNLVPGGTPVSKSMTVMPLTLPVMIPTPASGACSYQPRISSSLACVS